jgi:hypothetical protein
MRIFRVLAALNHAAKFADASEVPQEVPSIVADYVAAADVALDEVADRLRESPSFWQAPRQGFLYNLDDFIQDSIAGRKPEFLMAGPETVSPLLALEQQDAKMRSSMVELYMKTATASHWANTSAYSSQGMFFCLMKVTELMAELGERLRPIRSKEAHPLPL